MTLDLDKIDKTTDPAELLKMLGPWVDEETSRYKALHTEWEKNVLFFLGKQWIEKKESTDGFEIFEEQDNQYRPVTNYTAKWCDFKRSQVLGRNIRPVVRANSTKKNDIDASRLGTLALKAKHSIDKEEELDSLAFLHAQIFGIAWRSDYKQPVPNQYIEIPITEKIRNEFFHCPTCNNIQEDLSTCKECGDSEMQYTREDSEQMKTNPDGTPMVQHLPIYETKVSVIDSFRMRCNPCVVSSDLRWVHEQSIQPCSWMQEAYNVQEEGYFGEEQLKKIKKRDKMPRGLKISEQFANSVAHAHSSVGKEVSRTAPELENAEDSCIHNKLYIAPMAQHKFGRLLVWTDTAMLYDGKPDIPNNKKLKRWNPYTTFCYKIHPLRFEGIPFIEDIIPINKKINSLDAIILEHTDKTASPERVEFSNVNKNNQDQSDGVLLIDPRPELPNGGIPTYLQHPQMANEVYRMRSELVAEGEKIANVPEVVQGLRPAGVDTYGGLQLLRDAADSSESELYNRWYTYKRNSSQLKLAIIQECLIAQDPELVEMMEQIRANENMGIKEIKEFLGEDLRNNLNIAIEESDYLHESKGAEGDRVQKLIDGQILTINDISDPIVKLNLLRKLGVYTVQLPQQADIEKMEGIIQFLEEGDLQGAQSRLAPYDDPFIQSRVLKNWMKSPVFFDLPPPTKQAAMQMLDGLMQAQQPPPLPPGAQPPPGVTGAPMGAPPQ